MHNKKMIDHEMKVKVMEYSIRWQILKSIKKLQNCAIAFTISKISAFQMFYNKNKFKVV